MISDSLKEKAMQSRLEGYMVFDLEGGPIRLAHLIAMAQDIFPHHELDQLAITQAEDDQFVLAAELGIAKRPL